MNIYFYNEKKEASLLLIDIDIIRQFKDGVIFSRNPNRNYPHAEWFWDIDKHSVLLSDREEMIMNELRVNNAYAWAPIYLDIDIK